MLPNDVVLYTRQGCGLCDEAYAVLAAQGLRPREIDVDRDPALVQKWGRCLPVVEIEGRVRFRGRVHPVLLRRLLDHGRPPQPEP